MTSSTHAMAQRSIQAKETMITTLMDLGDISREAAEKVFTVYLRANVFNTQGAYHGAGYTVKHGAFLDKDLIRRAANLLPNR